MANLAFEEIFLGSFVRGCLTEHKSARRVANYCRALVADYGNGLIHVIRGM